MVNNSELLDIKISKNKNNDFGLVDEIIGLDHMEIWFQGMLYDMFKSASLKSFLNIKSKEKGSLQLLFHQDIFIETTHKYLDLEKKRRTTKKIHMGSGST